MNPFEFVPKVDRSAMTFGTRPGSSHHKRRAHSANSATRRDSVTSPSSHVPHGHHLHSPTRMAGDDAFDGAFDVTDPAGGAPRSADLQLTP